MTTFIKACGAVLSVVGIFVLGCTRQYSLDCRETTGATGNGSLSDPHPVPDLQPVLAHVSESEARAFVQNYLTTAVCSKELPERTRLRPYFFEVADLGRRYEVERFNEGWTRTSSEITVRMDNGLVLAFCFNRMVINCNRATKCECPYDFNLEPRAR